MRTRTALAASAAALVIALAVTSASAGRLSMSNQRFRITWAAIDFLSDGVGLAECPVTLEGSFHSTTIRKINGGLIGFVTRAITNQNACYALAGRAAFLELPWHIRYQSFSGTLPNITRIRTLIAGMAFSILDAGQLCLYEEDGAESISGEWIREAAGKVNTFAFDDNTHIPHIIGELMCAEDATLADDLGQVFLLGSSTTRIMVTLI
jgi:hypothetical protein